MLDKLSGAGIQVAKLRYLDADFQVLAPGSHVTCAVTGKAIPLDELKYWNWQRQEAYVDAAASLQAEKAAGTLS